MKSQKNRQYLWKCKRLQNLRASFDETENSITLTWTDPNTTHPELEQNDGFVLYMVEITNDLTKIAEVGKGVTQYKYTNLDGRFAYDFVIKPVFGEEKATGALSNYAACYITNIIGKKGDDGDTVSSEAQCEEMPVDTSVMPETSFGSANSSLLLSSQADESVHPTRPGEVTVSKTAKAVEGMVNTWDVTLRVEGMDSIAKGSAGEIDAAAKDATLVDPMGTGFIIPTGSAASWSTSQGDVFYDNMTHMLSWTIGNLTEPISQGSNIKYAQLTYRIEMTDGILYATPQADGTYKTNGTTVLFYTNSEGGMLQRCLTFLRLNPYSLYLKRSL